MGNYENLWATLAFYGPFSIVPPWATLVNDDGQLWQHLANYGWATLPALRQLRLGNYGIF